MKTLSQFNEDAAARAASFTGGPSGGGSGAIGTNRSSNYKFKTRKIELPSGKKKEPEKAPEKKPTQSTQKSLPPGKERKALPAAKERKQLPGSSSPKQISAAPEKKKITPSPQKKSIAGGSSSIVKRTSSELARKA